MKPRVNYIITFQMNRKMKRFWLMFFLSAVLIGCMDRVDNRDLKICNNSSDTIYFFISQNDVFTYPYQDYSDKELNIKNSVVRDSCIYFIDRPIYWNGFFKDCEDGKMRLFIVAKDSVEKYGLRKILSKNIYTKVFKVDINELEKSKWQIIYE